MSSASDVDNHSSFTRCRCLASLPSSRHQLGRRRSVYSGAILSWNLNVSPLNPHEHSLVPYPPPIVLTPLVRLRPQTNKSPSPPTHIREGASMASLLPPPSLVEGRMSQVLPTVKCSDCSKLVPIHELGEHVCAPPPSPSTSGPSLSNLLAQRVQEMVSSTSTRPRLSKTPPPKTPSPAPSLATRQAEVSARRSRALSVNSRKKSSSSLGPIPTLIPPMKPVPTEPLPIPISSMQEAPRTPDYVPPHHIPFPTSRSNTPNISVTPSPTRAPSVASNRSASSHPLTDSRDRGLSNASQLRPSFDSNRPRKLSTDTTTSPTSGRPPYDIPRTRTPSDNSRPNASYNQPPPIPPSTSPSVYTPSLQSPGSSTHRIPTPQNNTRPRTNGLVPPPQNVPPLVIAEQPIFRPIPEPDTKIGGEAGMAGVGRRGFQAAARAAMFTTQPLHLAKRPSPGFLDIQRAIGTFLLISVPTFWEADLSKERILLPYLLLVIRPTLRSHPILLSTSIQN